MKLNVGDLITFPNCGDTKGAEINSGRLTLPNGAPGYWRVVELKPDGAIVLRPVPRGVAEAEIRRNQIVMVPKQDGMSEKILGSWKWKETL